jgi:hypothetical protein
MRQATWAPFLTLPALLPLVDTQTTDHRKMLIQTAYLLLPVAALFLTTHGIRKLIKEAEVKFEQSTGE